MTAEPGLLPLPWIERYSVVGDIAYPVSSDPDGDYVAHDDHTAAMQAYARANVAHATAARDAEVDALRTKLRNVAGAEQELVSARRRIDEQEENIEALRAERDAAFRMSRCECASDECCANLIKHQRRAERLAEALRGVLPYVEHADHCGDHDAYNNATVPACGCGLDGAREFADALLREQEAGRG